MILAYVLYFAAALIVSGMAAECVEAWLKYFKVKQKTINVICFGVHAGMSIWFWR